MINRRAHPVKICDLTQFYSPLSGGVKRYLHEKIASINAHTTDEHLLIVPGARDEMRADGRARLCTIRSPIIIRSGQYRALLRLGAVRAGETWIVGFEANRCHWGSGANPGQMGGGARRPASAYACGR